MNNIPRIHNSVHSADKYQRATRGTPHSTGQLDRVFLRPYYRIVATIFRPYFRLPIANAYVIFDKQRIPLHRVHRSCVSYRQGLDLIGRSLVLSTAAVDQAIFRSNGVLIRHSLFEFHCTNAKASLGVHILCILWRQIQEIVRLVQISHVPPKNPTVSRSGQKFVGCLRSCP